MEEVRANCRLRVRKSSSVNNRFPSSGASSHTSRKSSSSNSAGHHRSPTCIKSSTIRSIRNLRCCRFISALECGGVVVALASRPCASQNVQMNGFVLDDGVGRRVQTKEATHERFHDNEQRVGVFDIPLG